MMTNHCDYSGQRSSKLAAIRNTCQATDEPTWDSMASTSPADSLLLPRRVEISPAGALVAVLVAGARLVGSPADSITRGDDAGVAALIRWAAAELQ